MLKLPDHHPVKKWLKTVSRPDPVSPEEEKKAAFLTEILTSKFNLITDLTVKNKIIGVLIDVPENTPAEKLMKSYLYLMIGNVTRSDNILRNMMKTPPVRLWEGYSAHPSFYQKLAIDNLRAMIAKISNHPSDRKTWELFAHYLEEFTNDPALNEELNENDKIQLTGKLQLLSVERISPELVLYLRMKRLDEKRLADRLRKKTMTMKDQAYWVWYFLPVDSVISEEFLPELASIEEKDPLWFMFLMENEKLSDFYSTKTGKAFLPGKRHTLRVLLTKKESFMPALWKLIELGDIDSQLVTDTVRFLSHE